MASASVKSPSMTPAISPVAVHGYGAVVGGQNSNDNVNGNGNNSYLPSQYAGDTNSHIPSSSQIASGPVMSSAPHSSPPYFHTDGNELNASHNYNTHEPESERNAMSSTTATLHPAMHASATAASGGSRFTEDWGTSQPRDSLAGDAISEAEINGVGAGVGGSGSGSIDGSSVQLPARTNTLKKKSSVRRSASLHRSSSRRSMMAGSVRSLALQSRNDIDESHSAFSCPVPTKGNPTDTLASRFQAWRKILKDLISYHREIHNHYEQRAKSVQKLSASLNAAALPPGFIVSGGLDDATQVLQNFHKQAIAEATKAREIEDDIILALTGLRSDLNQKIKEIKNISGDFRNSVDKEMDATKKAVKNLQEVIGQAELDSSLTTGRQDPYLLRLAVDRQLERQLQEENYLHQAFLNLEKSGRELESIVVGEIQKSYNAYAGILKREAGAAWSTVDELRAGPVAMPKDQEWVAFIRGNDDFVDPETPIRSLEQIHYPGQNHDACQEIRAGLLERKSKYLKSYTAGWYVLSPTHLHEFKSADKMQAPVMSLYLPEQKLGSHSNETAKSSKFVLKGRQTGAMHRGHTWVFRAESYDTMMAWYEDIKALTERTPQERNEYAHARGQQHSRSTSRASQYTYSSDGYGNGEDDDDDEEPFASSSRAMAAGASQRQTSSEDALSGFAGIGSGAAAVGASQQAHKAAQQRSPPPSGRRPSPGGRFPSDLQVNAQRGLELQASGVIPLSPTSATGSGRSETGSDQQVIAAAGAPPPRHQPQDPNPYAYPQQPQPQYVSPPSRQQQQQQQQYVPYGYANAQTGSTRFLSQRQIPEEDRQIDSFNAANPQSHNELSYPISPIAILKGAAAANGAAASDHAAVNEYATGNNTQPDCIDPREGRHDYVRQPSAPQGHDDALLLPAGGQPASEAAALPGREQLVGNAPNHIEQVTAINGVSVPARQDTGSKDAGKPGVLSRQESEAVTISNLHIPGGYPRTTGLD